MLTNDLSNNNISTSPPPPPPPTLPPGGLKNWKLPQDNGNSKKPSNVATSGISSRTEPKKSQSKSPVQQSTLNFVENRLFKQKQEELNANGETADEGSNIRQSEPNRGLTPKPVSPRVLSPQQDNGNSNKPSGTNNSTQSEKGLSENPIQLATEQKIDTPILINTLVGISKTAALKYSIATLLLCISSVTAGIYTYLSISVTLSDPVLFTVIAFVSASVMLSLAAYLINSHLSAINSEKGVDPGRKQSQDLQKAKGLEHSNTHTSSPPVALGTSSAPTPPTLKNNTTNKSIPSGGGKQQGSGDLMADLNKTLKSRRKAIDGEDDVQQQNNEVCQNQSQDSSLQKAKGLEHSNTPTPSFPVMSGTPSAPPPPPPPLPQNAAPLPPPPTASKYTEKLKNGAPKKANESEHDRSALIAQIKQGVKLKKVANQHEVDKKLSNNEGTNLIENVIERIKNSPILEVTKSSGSESDDKDDDQNRIPDSEWEDSTPSTPQSEDERGSKSPDSGHESDDNEKSKPTSPLHSVPKAGKPLVPPKTAGLQTKSEASPGAQANNVDPVNNEVQKPSSLVSQKIKIFGEKAHACQLKSVVDRGKRK
ncbi:WH2 domain-containing protein [Wolbachia endosymbiont (group B) of Horisme vitalbata]|uniref:WH2 domain-containing protein n=1 Tax=Wolbachia endosymbiont (group B) of Horisme vitalbata TaxID=3066178 RepID=UPI0033406C30